ncbi:MAG: OsmC family protein [Mycobacteriales bacterium]|nr:OsmC family protein [Mycobacteriales bacterium]
MITASVHHVRGDRFAIETRGHTFYIDQPVDAGGEDTAPTPVELLVASLSSCVAHYAHSYLRRHGLSEEGLAVHATAEMADRPARVGSITVELTLPPGVPEERRAALLAVASHCTVHNTLQAPPDVTVRLAP